MPTKKTTKKTKSKKRTYRKKKNQISLVKIFSFLFLFILVSIAGLIYLRTAFNKNDIATDKSAALNEKIVQVDKALKEVFFNYGISSNDLNLSFSEKTIDGVKWKFQEGKAELENFNGKLLSSELNKISAIENVSLNIKEKQKGLTTELSILGYKTHKLDFLSKKKKPVSKKIVKKDEPKKKVETKSNLQKNEIVKNAEKKEKPKIVIIVDDVGQKKDAIDRLIKIDYPINFAILPHLPFSAYAARKAHDNGKEVILHLPMEPKYSSGYTAADAGEGALLVGHSKTQVEKELTRNLNAFPHIKGVNNHMGSKFTENKELMRLVFANLKEKDLYFVDSLTSNRSYGARLADQMGLRFIKRDVFLDDSKKGKKYMINQIENLIRIAEKKGVGVGICHTYPESIEVLSEYLPKINGRVEIAAVTSIFN